MTAVSTRLLSLDDVPELTVLAVANREFLAPWSPLTSEALFTEAGPGAPFVLHSIHPLHTPPSVRASGAFDDEGTP